MNRLEDNVDKKMSFQKVGSHNKVLSVVLVSQFVSWQRFCNA